MIPATTIFDQGTVRPNEGNDSIHLDASEESVSMTCKLIASVNLVYARGLPEEHGQLAQGDRQHCEKNWLSEGENCTDTSVQSSSRESGCSRGGKPHARRNRNPGTYSRTDKHGKDSPHKQRKVFPARHVIKFL